MRNTAQAGNQNNQNDRARPRMKKKKDLILKFLHCISKIKIVSILPEMDICCNYTVIYVVSKISTY